jgi:predicted transcriptional regulator
MWAMKDQGQQQDLRLGDLQLKIMKVLWRLGQATVSEVHEQLAANRLAYTTVATMLRKMEVRGLVGHIERERRFVYRAAVSESEVTQSMTGDLLDRLFDGSLASAVSHLLETRDVSREELAELEVLLRQRKRNP